MGRDCSNPNEIQRPPTGVYHHQLPKLLANPDTGRFLRREREWSWRFLWQTRLTQAQSWGRAPQLRRRISHFGLAFSSHISAMSGKKKSKPHKNIAVQSCNCAQRLGAAKLSHERHCRVDPTFRRIIPPASATSVQKVIHTTHIRASLLFSPATLDINQQDAKAYKDRIQLPHSPELAIRIPGSPSQPLPPPETGSPCH